MKAVVDPAVTMSVAREPHSVRLVRVTSAAWATACGLATEQVDDWRIGVDELCNALVLMGTGDRLELEFHALDDGLVLTGRTEGTTTAAWNGTDFDVARQILAAVAPAYTIKPCREGICFRLSHPVDSGPSMNGAAGGCG